MWTDELSSSSLSSSSHSLFDADMVSGLSLWMSWLSSISKRSENLSSSSIDNEM